MSNIPLHLHGGIDEAVSCTRCDAVCCRLTVVVMPEDIVPRHLVDRNEHGVEVMEAMMGLTGIINIGKGSLTASYAKEGPFKMG